MYGLLSLNINDIMVYLCIQDINQIGFLQHNKIVESVKETESIFVGTPKWRTATHQTNIIILF